MTNWRNMALGALLFAFSITELRAPKTVTLKQAIEYALQNKAYALKAKLDMTNADAKILEAKAGTLPKVTGSTNITSPPIFPDIALRKKTFKMGQT